jgi:phage-related protein
MYTRPRFLEELHAIREEMSRECDYDMDLFAQFVNDLNQEIIEQIDPDISQDKST